MALKYWLVILALGIGWGASFMFNAILLRELGPLTVAAIRVGIEALGCWIYVVGTRLPVRLTFGRAMGLLGFGVLSYAAPFAFYATSQQHIASGVAGIVNAMTPAFAVMIAHLLPKGERATVLKSLGVICGFCGFVVLSLPVLQSGETSAIWAIFVALCAPACYAFSINIARVFNDMPPVVLAASALTGATFAIAPLALWREGVPQITRAETWAAMFMIGFVLTSAGFIILYWLLPKVGPTYISTVTLISPVSALVMGVVILREPLLPSHLWGMATIFLGLLLIDGRIVKGFGRSRKERPIG